MEKTNIHFIGFEINELEELVEDIKKVMDLKELDGVEVGHYESIIVFKNDKSPWKYNCHITYYPKGSSESMQKIFNPFELERPKPITGSSVYEPVIKAHRKRKDENEKRTKGI